MLSCLPKQWTVLLLGLLFGSVAQANPTITLTVSQNQLTLDNSVRVEVKVEGDVPDESQVRLDNVEAFEVNSAGTSNQFQFINGRSSRSTTYSYDFFPKQKGRFVIGPAILQDGRQSWQSNQVTLTVGEPRQSASPEERPYYLETTVEPADPFVGEQVVYTLRFYTRMNVLGAQLSLPDFVGFWVEELGEQKNYQQVINGIRWQVTEIKRALYPLQAGEIALPAASLLAEVRTNTGRRSPFDNFMNSPFFGSGSTQKVRLSAEPHTVKIQALPKAPAGIPELIPVGRMTLGSELSQQKLKVGDSITLTFAIQGEGNLRDFELGNFSADSLKVYEDQPQLGTEVRDGRLWSRKIFKWAIVPTRAGTITVPALKVPYFDPVQERYAWLESEPLDLQVTANPNAAVAQTPISVDNAGSSSQPTPLGTDIRPLRSVPQHLNREDIAPEKFQHLLWIGLLLVLFIGIALLVKWRYDVWRADERQQGLRFVRETWKSYLKHVTAETLLPGAPLALRTFIQGITGEPIMSEPPERLAQILAKAGYSAALAEQCGQWLVQCESAIYGGGMVSSELRQELYQQLLSFGPSLLKGAKR